MENLKVMVTGAGSGVGQGIIKSLRISNLPVTVTAADINPLNAGLFRADEAMLIPRVEEANALERMKDAIISTGIQVVMIGSEFDLRFFAENKAEIERDTRARVIVSSLQTVDIADDKWLTAEFLRIRGLPYAEAYVPLSKEDAIARASQWGYPLIIKARKGTSSRNVHVVNTEQELAFYVENTPGPMIQKLINIPSTNLSYEYTCSVFRCADNSLIGPFTARRTIRGGSSWIIEVAEFSFLHELLLDIAKDLPGEGSLNIQLMVGDDGPVPFELNARFSGTTAVRAFHGFNEPEMAIRNLVRGEKIVQPAIKSGLALRYLEEVFLENYQLKDLNIPLPEGKVLPWF